MNLYFSRVAAPCRTVRLVARALNLDLNLKHIDLGNGDHRTPEYLKLNPLHTVPVLDDSGFVLRESRAIITYLVDQYGNDDSLYPKDLKKRAIVNERLHLDAGTIHPLFFAIYYPMLFGGASVDDRKMKKLEEVFHFLDNHLGICDFVAGGNLTVADHTMVTSVSTLEAVGFNVNRFRNMARWYSQCKSTLTGYEECNSDGVKFYKQLWLTHVNKPKVRPTI